MQVNIRLIGAAVSPAQSVFTVAIFLQQQNHSPAHLHRLVSLAQQTQLHFEQFHTHVTIPDKQPSRPSYPIRDPINGHSLCNYSCDFYSSILAIGSSQAPKASPSFAKLLETCLSQPLGLLRSSSAFISEYVLGYLSTFGQSFLISGNIIFDPTPRHLRFRVVPNTLAYTLEVIEGRSAARGLHVVPYLICMSQHNHIT